MLIENNLPSLQKYLNSRLLDTKQFLDFRGRIVYDDKAIASVNAWCSQQELSDFLKIEKEAIPSNDTRIKLKLIDIPKLTGSQSLKIYEKLSESINKSLFQDKIIQKLIDYSFPRSKKQMINYLLIPQCFYLLLFLIYKNYFYQKDYEGSADEIFGFAIIGMLLLLSAYFLKREIDKGLLVGYNYFEYLKNYIDLICPISIIFWIFRIFYKSDSVPMWFDTYLLSICSLLIWIRQIYSLKIYSEISQMIRMIQNVIHDLKTFLLVLILTILAFGDAFRYLAETSDDEETGLLQTGLWESALILYKLVLSDYDSSYLSNGIFSQILFLLCTLIIIIVMFNLLIAIVSNTYTKSNQNALSDFYQERAQMIYENSYLISFDNKKDQYLAVTTYEKESLDQNEEEKEKFDNLINELESRIMEKFEKQNQEFVRYVVIEEKIDNLEKKLEKVLGSIQLDEH